MSRESMKILVIDDDIGDAELLRHTLGEVESLDFDLVHCMNAESGIETQAQGDIGLTFLDYQLGAATGLSVVKSIRDGGDIRPVIALTALGDEYVAKDMISAGADDYLVKSDLSPDTVLKSIERATAQFEVRRSTATAKHQQETLARELAEMNIELSQMNRIDPLTRLLHRGAWAEAAALEHERAMRYDRRYAIMMIDVDFFKRFNDSQGHQQGDVCLQHVANALLDGCRKVDSLGRYGGEEFVVLVPEIDDRAAWSLAERMRKKVAALGLPHAASEAADHVTVSIGVASSPAARWEDVVQKADEALYMAKEQGRNRVCVHPRPSIARESPRDKHDIRILLIDDDADDALILQRMLDSIPEVAIAFRHVADPESGIREILSEPPDYVFLDYQLGAETGLEVLRSIRSSGFLGSVIMLTGHGDEYVAASLIKAGADDYIGKGNLDSDVLRRALQNAQAQSAHRSAETQKQDLLVELKAAKKSLQEKNRRLSGQYETALEFVDNVSHEFRTPLTVIKEFTAILREGLAGDVNEEQAEYLDIIGNRVDDLSIMVDDMLDISKLEAGVLGISRSPCVIDEIMERVRTTIERKAIAARIDVCFETAAALHKMYCDPEKIGRVIINLAINALKFSPEGGRVIIRAEDDSLRSDVRISVIDTGPGISSENVRLIFERFRQFEHGVKASTKGFGLGLNIAKELVHLNFGEISVESELGKGSRFWFTVPWFEPSSLITRYLSQVELFRNGSSHVSLIDVTISASAEAVVLEELSDFLSGQMRRTDLPFRVAPHRWLIVAASNGSDISPLEVRINERWSELARSRQGEDIPPVCTETRGTWIARSEKAALIRAFNALGVADLDAIRQEVHS